ncbi:hypothetical protein BGZ76_000698 [Entomortierella beljakovae]|nr:hypothetical protein BGZ76_000698 [Entomortierella beljakovae]
MRTVYFTLALTLVFTLLASAAPVKETQEQFMCIEECLSVEEECLLNSIAMLECVNAYDVCHTICVPDEPEKPEPPKNKDEKVSDPEDNQDKTEEEKDKDEDDDGEDDEEDDGFIEIPAPKGGEDDEEYDDDTSDY